MKPVEMVYDETVKKCRILSGEKCSFTVVESRTDTNEETRVTESFECVENATCLDEYCSCLPDWYEDTEGMCRSKKVNGQQCNSDNECREDLKLKCENGICLCDHTEAVMLNGQCVAKVGASCAKYSGCVPNAECPYHDRICTCQNGYENSTNGLCLGQYGLDCYATLSPCIQAFSCFDRKCGCPFPQHQKFDDSTGKCVSYSQGPCLEYVNGSALKFSCVSNAECITKDNFSECICSDGYIHSLDRECYVAHGQPCIESKSCDPLANLVCRNGRCECEDLHIYDEYRTVCVGLVGAQCSLNSHFCQGDASCQSNRFNFRDWPSINKMYSTSGTCRCTEGYVSTQRGNVFQESHINN